MNRQSLRWCGAGFEDKESNMMLATVSSQVHTVTQSGIGIGSAIAIVLSWHRNRSIGFAIVHGILSWIYVIHFAVTRADNERHL